MAADPASTLHEVSEPQDLHVWSRSGDPFVPRVRYARCSEMTTCPQRKAGEDRAAKLEH
jgi:hypothetical protein